ncbi:MAG: biliverdin-producing heme oxygenase [Pyrinomonadaceae bacterium]
MKKLKEATSKQHEELEDTVDIMNRMFSREDYRNLLEKFRRFYAAIEPKIAAVDLERFGMDFEKRRKTALLENDLKSLDDSQNADHNASEFIDLPNLSTPSRAFGSLYVLEGATLGGQVITRHLKQHLDITPENGGMFFNSYGAEVGPMWKSFAETITRFAEETDDDDSIVEAARETFDSFRRCMLENKAAAL